MSKVYRGHKSHSVALSYAVFNHYKFDIAVLFVEMLRTHEYCVPFISSLSSQNLNLQKTLKILPH